MIKQKKVRIPIRSRISVFIVPPNDFMIRHGRRMMLLKRDMFFNAVGERIGSFLGYFAAKTPTIDMINSFIIAFDEFRIMDTIIDEPIHNNVTM